MIINKNSGDDLARIFQDLLNKNIKKTAAYHAKDGENDAKDGEAHCAEDHVHDASCMAEDDLADDAADKELDNAIQDMILDGDAKDINGYTFKYREDPIILDPRNEKLDKHQFLHIYRCQNV